jgi:hypothetical protein
VRKIQPRRRLSPPVAVTWRAVHDFMCSPDHDRLGEIDAAAITSIRVLRLAIWTTVTEPKSLPSSPAAR